MYMDANTHPWPHIVTSFDLTYSKPHTVAMNFSSAYLTVLQSRAYESLSLFSGPFRLLTVAEAEDNFISYLFT